jgi:hypothetical protein
MSLATIRNGLVETLKDSGKWSAAEISTCDFGLMTTSASCVILQPGPGTQIEPLSLMGGDNVRGLRVTWEMSGMVFVKDPGAPTCLLGSLWTACDDILGAVHRDDTLNGAAQVAMVSAISRPSLDSFVTDGSTDWGYIAFTVRAEEFLV